MLSALHYLWIVYLMVNAASFALYGYDKHRARQNQWRIRESALLGITWLLGGAGAWLGMRVFRHKTKHKAFIICAPLAAVAQAVLMGWATLRLLGIL